MADVVDSMLDLMRRLPPPRVGENIAALATLSPDHADELLGSVDQPLAVRTCARTGREYLACDYNRDGEAYRYALGEVRPSARADAARRAAGARGRTSTTRRSRTGPRRARSCASSRRARTPRSTRTASSTTTAGSRPSTSGTSTTAGSRASCC
jgi:hypothetical protein